MLESSDLCQGTPPGAELAPNDPNARSATPMNEADDFAFLRWFHESFTADLLLIWSTASAETKKLLATPGLSDQQLAAAIASAWREPLAKLANCTDIVEHLEFLVTELRVKGILTGDPREREVLAVRPDGLR
jgi:hypothetical protein